MITFFSRLLTAIDISLTIPLFTLSKLVPRKQNLWVFIGWHKGPDGELFADNSKYLFLYAAKHNLDIQSVWLAKDMELVHELRKRGYIAHLETSIAGVWTALRAGTTVVDATLQRFNARWTGKTRLVQLLHGKGMKLNAYSEELIRPYDYVFNTSDSASALLPSVLTSGAKVLSFGYSRHAALFGDDAEFELGVDTSTISFISSQHAVGRRVIMYAPTFRRGMKELPTESFLPLAKMSDWLTAHNCSMVVHLHPKYRMQSKESTLSHIHFAGDGDVAPVLRQVDVLVTDYSSIFTDFLLLDRPMVFYAFDLAEYSEREGISIDYSDVPGEIANDFPALLAALERAQSTDPEREKRQRSLTFYHTHKDGLASGRIMNELTKSSA